MKIKSLIFLCCFGLLSNVFAGTNQHIHPKANDQKGQQVSAAYSNCDITIINNSFDNVQVTGTFDDGSPLIPFSVYSFEAPHYISLYYYNYCHSGMYLTIRTFNGHMIYNAYTPTNMTIRIVPYLNNQLKAEVSAK
ncbi:MULTISPECIES: hypothetical protein [Legionella]|uniref:Secreted protein n=1 Tax=Legionella septentrionalis TaxID=2498109 RepID=A0A3S0V9V6_9GAMM|nr:MULTISPECIES: hypothetical protein [Legionella]MCP0913026.1 hypothetical protein [Legionella sp. 27cVA30]RUQ81686.1 hypothetical protein EKM59_09885 [Legionella septentrionalis]RUQ98509.1 hypothetical protein ELY11_05685 [Legionella septentrionalis]RUR10896.1 hypothetical protein ELY14_03585 [Legionella septentrionalis]RUR15336.1 hypothetical protein ELY10_05915 [Legionella septentrionalis]